MLVSLFLSYLLFQAPLDVGGRLSENQASINTKEMRLALEIDPESETISGFAETRYEILNPNLKSLDLELVDSLTVKAVTIDGKPRPFKQGNNKLSIGLPEELGASVLARIDYGGKPTVAKRPPWDGGFNWSKTDSGQPWIGVSCQGEGGQVWYPCKGHQVDKIEGLTLEITVPEPLYCAATGLLQKIEPARPGWRTFHWTSKYPISSYNVNISIADYQIVEGTLKASKDMPVVLYMLKEYQKADQESGPEPYAEKIETLKNQAIQYLTVLGKLYGEYPFLDEKFGLAHTHYLGMEHQTLNAYGAHFVQRNGLDGLMIHEMGHEWWGNKLTAGDLADFWLQEGICTYSTGAYMEETAGLEAALGYYRSLWFRISNSKPIVQGKDITEKQAYFPDIYGKGALVIHALRWLLGKEALDKTLYSVMNDPKLTYANTASTADLIATAERLGGRELDWFFQRYVYTAAPPALNHWQANGVLHLRWDDVNFPMPIELELTKGEEVRYERIELPSGAADYPIPTGTTVKVDPRQWVYMTLTEKKPK